MYRKSRKQLHMRQLLFAGTTDGTQYYHDSQHDSFHLITKKNWKRHNGKCESLDDIFLMEKDI